MSLFLYSLPNVFPCDVIVQEKRWRGEERGIISPYFPGARSKKCKKPILIVTTIIICSSSFPGFFVWHQSVRYDDTKQDERNVLLFLQKHPQQMNMIKTVVHHHSEKHHALNLNEIFNWSQKLPSAWLVKTFASLLFRVNIALHEICFGF